MTRKILLTVTTLGLLSFGGCYLSSIGVYARYEDYDRVEVVEDYPGYCYDCHSSPHYGQFHGCGEYVFAFSAHGYSYRPRVAEVVVVENEDVRHKESSRRKEKLVRKSSKKTY
jgi:hypothetical protein